VGDADLVRCKININFTFVIWLSNRNKVHHFNLEKPSVNGHIPTMVLSCASKNKKHCILKVLN
jgi:hypothetical protein